MKTITFTCETITPMFLNGADGVSPELRPPAIKAALRFWWRAMNGHLSLSQLKKEEAKIFGGSGENETGRSKLIVRITTPNESMNINKVAMLPHRAIDRNYGNPSEANAITERQTFTVKIGIADEQIINEEKAKALFELAVVLGGLGKRARRGMGSIKITQLNSIPYNSANTLEGIKSLLDRISPHFAVQSNAINNVFNGRMDLYPWIKQIQIGNTVHRQASEILIKTGKTASDLLRQNGEVYEASLGHANRGRFASPIYVSVLEKGEGFVALITTLNTIPDRGKDKTEKVLQEEFKRKIF